MFFGAFAELIERIGEVFALMPIALLIGIVVVTGLVFIELFAIFENIGAILLTSAESGFPVHIREQIIDLTGGERRIAIDKHMRMQRFALVAIFVAHTPVERAALNVRHDRLDSVMGKAVFKGIVDGNLPFTGLFQVQGVGISHFVLSSLSKVKIQKYRSAGGGNTVPPALVAAIAATDSICHRAKGDFHADGYTMP